MQKRGNSRRYDHETHKSINTKGIFGHREWQMERIKHILILYPPYSHRQRTRNCWAFFALRTIPCTRQYSPHRTFVLYQTIRITGIMVCSPKAFSSHVLLPLELHSLRPENVCRLSHAICSGLFLLVQHWNSISETTHQDDTGQQSSRGWKFPKWCCLPAAHYTFLHLFIPSTSKFRHTSHLSLRIKFLS